MANDWHFAHLSRFALGGCGAVFTEATAVSAEELLNDPNSTLHAAAERAADKKYSMWDPAFGWWLNKRERVMRKLGLRKVDQARQPEHRKELEIFAAVNELNSSEDEEDCCS